MQTDQTRAAEAARGALAAETERLCGEIDTIASALHDTASNLSQRDEAAAARYVDAAADRLQRLGGRLKGRDPAELAANAGRFAREEPGTFFATAVVSGFLLSRFMKASSEPRSDSQDDARLDSTGTAYPSVGAIDDPDAYLSQGGI